MCWKVLVQRSTKLEERITPEEIEKKKKLFQNELETVFEITGDEEGIDNKWHIISESLKDILEVLEGKKISTMNKWRDEQCKKAVEERWKL